KQLALVSKVRTEMKANAFGVAVLQPIVKLLVVTKAKTLLLKLPFQVPICLSDEEKVGVLLLNCGDKIDPILGARAHSSTATPSPLKNLVQEKHCHVTTNPIALSGDAR